MVEATIIAPAQISLTEEAILRKVKTALMTLAEDQAATTAACQPTEATTIATATVTHQEATLQAHHVHRTAAEEA